MRETLHQLTLALALPIAVVVVWGVRGELAGAGSRETADAYLVELDELPLPTPERLRTPEEAFAWGAPRVTPEDPTPRQRRLALPDQLPSTAVDFAVEADSEAAATAPPSPGAEPELPGAAPGASLLPAPIGAPALVAAASTAAPYSQATTPKVVASTLAAKPPTTISAVPSKVPATASAVSAHSATASAAVKTAAPALTDIAVPSPHVQPSPGNSVAKGTPPAILQKLQNTWTPSHIAALDLPPGLLPRDSAPVSSSGPVSIPDRALGLPNAAPSVADPIGLPEIWHAQAGSPNGHAPLTPAGHAETPPFGLSLKPDSFEPSIELIELPLPALASAAAPGFSDQASDFSTPAPVFRWNASLPITPMLIPEPASALLLGAALAAFGAARRRRGHLS